MSDPELRVRRDVQWSPELTAEYLGAAAPSPASCNSALIEVVAIADRLAGGRGLMSPDATSYVTPALPDGQLAVGATISSVAAAGGLRPLDAQQRALYVAQGATAEQLDNMEQRKTMVLALCQVAREMGQSSAGGVRGAGWVQIAAAAVAAALVGLAVDWYCARASRADQATRVRQSGIVAASRDAAERARVFAETGTLPPPTPVETAAAESIRGAAEQAREAGIGQQIGTAVAETVSGLGKVAAAVAVIFVGVELFKARRS